MTAIEDGQYWRTRRGNDRVFHLLSHSSLKHQSFVLQSAFHPHLLPREEILLRTMAQMFDRNPEFVCEFVSDMIKQGEEEKQKQQADEARKRWRTYA
jgi:hypothetical protein